MPNTNIKNLQRVLAIYKVRKAELIPGLMAAGNIIDNTEEARKQFSMVLCQGRDRQPEIHLTRY